MIRFLFRKIDNNTFLNHIFELYIQHLGDYEESR